MRICVYGAASEKIDEAYKKEVEKIGHDIVKRGHSLVFGGGGNGLMGAVARGVHDEGGHIIGVIPKFFEEGDVEIVFPHCDQLIKPDTMRERKQIMEDAADAFLIVPGGIGTFEEFFEILTLKQLCRMNKPIAVYNFLHYYDDMVKMVENSMEKHFIGKGCKKIFRVSEDMEELFAYIEDPVREQYSIRQLKDG